MELIRYARARNWPVVAGYLLFIGMMAIGYFYNVTFVQLGLKDLGERVLGLSAQRVATDMALLALITCLVALAMGFWMLRRGWSTRLMLKLRLAFGVVVVQTFLTAAAPHVPSEAYLLAWIVACSLALGVGVPVTFSMTTDLIPVRDRGYVAAAITAVAYTMAAVLPADWRIETLSRLLLVVMAPGALGLGALLWLATTRRRMPLSDLVATSAAELAQNHRLPRFGNGRFVQHTPGGSARISRRFLGFVVLMFGIFFIDSLGFLRIIDTPILVEGAWLARDLTPRAIIAATHVVTAVIAGVLYTHLSGRYLFYWIFGIFALTHLAYTLRVWLLPETMSTGLATPLLYATAVSLYTVLNFALWADFSTARTISRNVAIGVAFSGWTATFISTALAIRWQTGDMPLDEHLRIVDALALVFFGLMLVLALLPRGGPQQPAEASDKQCTRTN